jgi:hypothetical protein
VEHDLRTMMSPDLVEPVGVANVGDGTQSERGHGREATTWSSESSRSSAHQRCGFEAASWRMSSVPMSCRRR